MDRNISYLPQIRSNTGSILLKRTLKEQTVIRYFINFYLRAQKVKIRFYYKIIFWKNSTTGPVIIKCLDDINYPLLLHTDEHTVCLRSSYSFYIVSYYIKWVATSWTYSILENHLLMNEPRAKARSGQFLIYPGWSTGRCAKISI